MLIRISEDPILSISVKSIVCSPVRFRNWEDKWHIREVKSSPLLRFRISWLDDQSDSHDMLELFCEDYVLHISNLNPVIEARKKEAATTEDQRGGSQGSRV